MGKFLIQLVLVSLLSAAGYYFLGKVIPAKFYFVNFYWLIILFIITTLAFHFGLKSSFEKGSKDFVRYYMGATGAKLFVFLFIIIIYAFISKATAMAFTLAFFFFYLVFTVFEVTVAFKQFGNKKQVSDTDTVSKS